MYAIRSYYEKQPFRLKEQEWWPVEFIPVLRVQVFDDILQVVTQIAEVPGVLMVGNRFQVVKFKKKIGGPGAVGEAGNQVVLA